MFVYSESDCQEIAVVILLLLYSYQDGSWSTISIESFCDSGIATFIYGRVLYVSPLNNYLIERLWQMMDETNQVHR